MTTRAASATARSEASSVTSACSSGTSTPRRSDSASSFARLRPASAHRTPSPAWSARYWAVSAPVKPVAPRRTMSYSRSGMGGDSMSAPMALGVAMLAPVLLALLLLRLGLGRAGLRLERARHEALDERPDRPLRDTGVDAGLAGLRAAVAEARRADQPRGPVERFDQQRAARVALAGVGAALRVAGAQHRTGVERPGPGREAVGIRAGAVRVGQDRHGRALHRVRRARRILRREPEAGDGRRGPRIPDLALAGRGDVHGRHCRGVVEL